MGDDFESERSVCTGQAHPYASLLSARRDLAIESVNLLLEGLRVGDLDAIEIALRSLGVKDEGSEFTKIHEMTDSLHGALDEFRYGIMVSTTTNQTGLCNAASRLEEVIQLTFEAANRTLDVSERQCDIFQNQLEGLRYAKKVLNDPSTPFEERVQFVNRHFDAWEKQIVECQEMNLNVLVAQSFQDLAGQAIKKVITLVKKLEDQLGRLNRVFGGHDQEESAKLVPTSHTVSQDEADSLFSSNR